MNWKKYETQLESLPERSRAAARRMAERLVERDGMDDDEAVLEVMRRYGPGTRKDAPKDPRALTSPDVSLAVPHGPEGESHGGRPGGDPLRFVEDSTPKAANAYSRTRGSPAESARRVGRTTARAARRIPPARRATTPRLRTPARAGEKGAVKRIPARVKSARTAPMRGPARRQSAAPSKRRLPRSPG